MFKNGLYNLLGTGVRLGLSILSVPLLLQTLGASAYGLYSILMAIINIAILSEWSINMVMVVFITHDTAESEKSEVNAGDTLRQAFLLVAGLAVVTTVLLWLVSPWLSQGFSNLSITDQIVLQKGCQLSSIIVMFRLLQQYFIGIEQAHGQYKLLNSINTVFNISQTTLILLVARWYEGILPLIVVQAGLTIIFLAVHYFYCYRNNWLKEFRWIGKHEWGQFKRMLIYGGRTIIGGIGSAFFSQGTRLIVGRVLGLEASGIYAALTGIATQIHALSTISIQPLVPALTNLVAQKGPLNQTTAAFEKELKVIISRALMLSALVAVSMGCVMVALAPEINLFLFKGKIPVSFKSTDALRITACIYTLYPFNAVGYYILFAVKRELVTTLVALVCGPLSLLLIGLLAYTYGLTGALIGNAGYLLTLYMVIDGFKSLQLQWSLWIGTVWEPLLIFFGITVTSTLVDSLIERVIILVISLALLCVPLIKEGKQYILAKRERENVV